MRYRRFRWPAGAGAGPVRGPGRGSAQAGRAAAKDRPRLPTVLEYFPELADDGVPDDKNAAAKVIVNAANALSADDELTFLFVQVGNDPAAGAYLKKLDDDLTGAKFDIVDAKTMAEAEAFATTADLVIAAIND